MSSASAALRLRRLRSHPALWGDHGPAKAAQVSRLILACKARLAPSWDARAAALRHERGQRLLATLA